MLWPLSSGGGVKALVARPLKKILFFAASLVDALMQRHRPPSLVGSGGTKGNAQGIRLSKRFIEAAFAA